MCQQKLAERKCGGPPFAIEIGLIPFAGANENAQSKLRQQIALNELFLEQAFVSSDLLEWNERSNSYLESVEKFGMEVSVNSVHDKVLQKCNITPTRLAQVDAAVPAGKHNKSESRKKKMKGKNAEQDIVGDQTEKNARETLLRKRHAIEHFFSNHYSYMDLHELMAFGEQGERSLHQYKSIRNLQAFGKHLAFAYVTDGNTETLPEGKTPFICTRNPPAIEWSISPKDNVKEYFPTVCDIENILSDNITNLMFLKTANSDVQLYNSKKRAENCVPASSTVPSLQNPISTTTVQMATSESDLLEDRIIVTGKEVILGERWKVQVAFKSGHQHFQPNAILKMQKISTSNPKNVVIAADISNNILKAFTVPISNFSKVEDSTPPVENEDDTPPEDNE